MSHPDSNEPKHGHPHAAGHGQGPSHGAGGPPGGHGHGGPPAAAEPLDLREKGALIDGVRQTLDKRLFVQLVVFECGPGTSPEATAKTIAAGLREAGLGGVVYADVNDPRGLGIATWTTEPADFVTKLRPIVNRPELALRPRPSMTMLGRTYSTGFEQELEYWMLRRPIETLQNPELKWGVWYPLRRTGAFARLDAREQGAILREHGMIGKAYGDADHAHDVRLACHGLDTNDNEFVIGLIGKELYPLSHVVQAMRKTRQTSEFIQQMGPFFVGHVIA
jgi:chlorite dismutase